MTFSASFGRIMPEVFDELEKKCLGLGGVKNKLQVADSSYC